MNKVKSTFILSLLILVAFLSHSQVQESSKFVPSNALVQTIETPQNDGFESDGLSDERQIQIILSHRLSASEFQHAKQLTPVYELAIELQAEDLSSKHFVYIRTIPDIQPWFELAAFVPNKSRISGWKDSRPLHLFSDIDLIFS
ncbi:hypothetical protein EYS14_00200 [Alteromonadaceae bacterium M269]|nr:hypothetical protein EYS14_00200 [Alteromonadaceae bacterium M269]